METDGRVALGDVVAESGERLAKGGDAAEVASGREEERMLEDALAKMPQKYRLVLSLREQRKLTFSQLGEVLSRSSEAARKLWARAAYRLAVELKSGRPTENDGT